MMVDIQVDLIKRSIRWYFVIFSRLHSSIGCYVYRKYMRIDVALDDMDIESTRELIHE
jgi:hypothetical protein